jgi:gamma-glutamyltranspeptidase/glutathione hydrolase
LAALDETAKTFGKTGGKSYAPGEIWRQPELARTLGSIASRGDNAFYRGPLARKMAHGVRVMGGIWSAEDLAGYRAVVREPIEFGYHGHLVMTMPPPSAGGIVLRQILAAADVLRLHELEYESVTRLHLYVEALRRTYADRNQLLGDPDFVDVPLQQLLAVDYVAQRMAGIDPRRATASADIEAGVELKESEQTTHFSVVDGSGVAVANTLTLNGSFGARVQIPGTGVTLNNEMDDFTAKVGTPNMFGLVQGPQNAIEPGKRMLSSMSPTIVTQHGKVRAVVGSPGGATITTTVAQIIMQLVDYGRSLEDAIAAPRVHHQWLPDKVWHEAALPDSTARALGALGHKLARRHRIGHANCIEVEPKTGWIYAVADAKRNGGKASAY